MDVGGVQKSGERVVLPLVRSSQLVFDYSSPNSPLSIYSPLALQLHLFTPAPPLDDVTQRFMLPRLPRLLSSSTTTRAMSTHSPTRSLTLQHLATAVEQLTPLSLAENSWDNVGLLIEAPKERPVQARKKGVMCCIDRASFSLSLPALSADPPGRTTIVTTPVLLEALHSPSTCTILTYHPPIFSGLKSLTLSTPLQRSLLECIAAGMSIFTIHTAADNALEGVNDFMAKGLVHANRGKGEVKAIVEKDDVPRGQEGAGSGRLVHFGDGMTREAVVSAVKEILGLKYRMFLSFLSLSLLRCS